MISNEEYELSKPLASALKGKAPFVGLPIPGHAPLIFKREFLQRALKGVKPVFIGVQTFEGSTARALVIEGVAGPRVRTKYRLLPIDRNRLLGRGMHWNDPIAKEYAKWTEKSIKSKVVEIPVRRGFKAKMTVVAKLERELAKIRATRPVNPAIYGGYRPNSYVSAEARAYHAASVMRWNAQRRTRTVIGALGRSWAAQMAYTNPSVTKLYARLREMGVAVQTYSEIPQRAKDHHGIRNVFDYLKKLHLFCGLETKPFEYGHLFDREGFWGPERYNDYLSGTATRRMIQSQIDSIRDMAQAA